jgi:hypothetical protein
VSTPANILVAEPRIYFDPSYSSVPDAMKQVDQWLAFLVKWNPETEHFDKTPLNSSGRVENNHQAGESFATMLEYTKRNPGTVLGFYVRPPFIAIDLDGGLEKEATDITDWASAIIREIGSYAELSPSGTGIHIIGLGTKPGNKSKIGNVEIYTDKRALTFTNVPVNGYETLKNVDVTSVYNKMVSRAYVFGETKHERVLNERASSGEGNRIHHAGHMLTSLLTLLSTGDYTPDAKPFHVTDKYDNWIEYPSQSEAISALLVCLARRHDCDEDEMEQGYLDSHLSDIPKWANGKWERLGKSEIQSAIDFVREPQSVAAKEQSAAPASPAASTSVEQPAAGEESLPWTEPRPFEPLLSPVPSFKIEYLPAAFRPWASDVAERMSIPLDYVGICMLITFASVIGRRAFVQPKENDKSWTEPINLLGAVIASSGGMKTPTWKTFTNEIIAIEMEWKKAHEREVAKYKMEVAKYFEANKGKKKDAREGVLPEQPEPYRRLVINDATPESAHILMGKNPEGLLLYRDEIGGWLVELDKSGRESAREIFLVAANGNDSHTQDRVERGEVSAIMCLSFFGGMQPKIAQDMVNDERNAADGTIARLGLLSYPDRTEIARPLDRALNEEARASFRRALRVLAPLQQKQIMLRFSQDAQPIFNEWLRVHFEREFALDGPIASHFSKYKGLLPRLAALYHLADAASSAGVKAEKAEEEETSFGDEMSVVGLHVIGAEHVKRAITFLAEYLEPHMRRLYGCVQDPMHRAEVVLGERIMAGELEDGFTARDVKRKRWASLGDYGPVYYALEGMCDMGWLRSVKSTGVGQPTVKYEINPKVKELRRKGESNNGSQS